jgi:hypothetical protein
MNNDLKSFVTNVGVLCETWGVAYNSFLAQGMSPKDAMAHTQGFMTAFLNGAVNGNGGNK